MFGSIQEKREYVRERLIQKGDWDVRELRESLPEESPLEKVLLVSLSMGNLGQKKSPQPKPERPEPDARCPNCMTPFVSSERRCEPFCSPICRKVWPSIARRIRNREKLEETAESASILILLPFPSF
jgi:endogenous inhibitor of DNA gyrase (YacG/DUF329 family)